MDLLIILYNVINKEKYERLQRKFLRAFSLSFFFRELQTNIFYLIGRLEHFVKAAEDLM
jgi:hypothetical protein